jgi:hypothetical protein
MPGWSELIEGVRWREEVVVRWHFVCLRMELRL